MRIGLDAHMVGEHETGNETYVLGLLHGFDRLGVAVDAYALHDFPAGRHRLHRIRPRNSLLRIPFASPVLALRDRLDVYHATYVLPPLLPCASVVTIHDLTYELFPEWFAPRVHRMLSTLVPLSLRRASRIITISERTRQDITRVYGIPPDRITVTYLAPRPGFDQPLPRSEHEPFFLYVGNLEPRKNVETLIAAMRLLRDRGLRLPLLLAGNLKHRHADLLAQIEHVGLGDLVRLLGYVPDEELRHLFAACTALVHPARYEGFGLTVAEGMAQGIPVLASRAASIPEVAGDAALLLDPDDPEAWADAMAEVAESPRLRDLLRARGLQRAQLFSWERTAAQTEKVYLSLRSGAAVG